MRPINMLCFAALLFLPARLQAQEAQGYAPAGEASADIVETAKGAGSFNTLTKADIPASNGVIHVVDTVLLPE